MSGLIYFNGILVNHREAAIPLSDRAYLYGEGLFETMKATQGRIPFLSEHLERFTQSFPALGLRPPWTRGELEHAVYQTLKQNHLSDAYLRMQLSRENEAFGGLQPADRYNLIIVAQALNPEVEKIKGEGMAAVRYPDYTVGPHPLRGIKSTDYAVNLLAKAYANQHNAQEALLADGHGQLVEGGSSNLFIWDGLSWITPPLQSGALPGVMRRVLLGLMKARRIPFEEGLITPQALALAPEAILTNAIWEIMPLSRWEGQAVGTGRVGEATRHLQGVLREDIRARIDSAG